MNYQNYRLYFSFRCIFLALSSCLLCVACAPSLSMREPAGGEWKLRNDAGFSYSGKNKLSEKNYKIMATTGWVEGKAVVAGCHNEDSKNNSHCEVDALEYALYDKERGQEIAFGVYAFPSLELHPMANEGFDTTYYELRPSDGSASFPLWVKTRGEKLKSAQERLFKENRLIVWSDAEQAYGYIDSNAQTVIKPQFLAANDFEPDGRANVALASGFGSIDLEGNYAPDKPVCIYVYENDDLFTKVAYEGKNENIAWDIRFNLLAYKSDAIVSGKQKNTENNFCKKAKWHTVVDKQNVDRSVYYDDIQQSTIPRHYFVSRNANWGIMNSDAQIVFPLKEKKFHTMYLERNAGDRRILAVVRDGLSYLYHVTGVPIYLEGVDVWQPTENGIIIKIADKYGIVNYNGEVVVEPIYHSYFGYYLDSKKKFLKDERNYAFKLGNKWGVLSIYGEKLLDFKYDKIDEIYSDIASVVLRGKLGVVNFRGEEVVPFIYDKIGAFDAGRALAYLGEESQYVYSSEEAKRAWDKIREDKKRQAAIKAERERQAAIEKERQSRIRAQEAELARRENLQNEINALSDEISELDTKIVRLNEDIVNYGSDYLIKDRDECVRKRRELVRRMNEKERLRRDIARGF
ncbi:MAG: WG repeat-containing protein [Bradymonadales bacterium]